MIRVNYKLAALALSAFGALLPAFAQGPAPANTLSGVLNSPGSLQARLRFEHLTTADGLSNDSVFSILQDRRGFMWFGTQGGLNRYDGYRITQYRHDPKNPNSLGDDFVQILFEDSRGGIWSGRAFLSRFDPDTETFTRYNLPEGGTGNRATSVWGIAEDRQGFVWVVTTSQHPLYRYDPRTDKFSVQDLGKDAPSSQGFMTLQATADGILWMGRDNTLVRFDPATLTSSSYHPDASAADGGIRISAVALDRKGGLWLASRPGAPNFFDPVTGEFSRKGTSGARPNLPPTGIDSIISPGPDGTMWVGTSMGGLKVFDPDTGASGSLRHDPADPRSLSRNEVLSIAGDREGNLWVGVKGGGVNLLSARSTAFGAWRRSPDDPNGLSDDNVRAISGDRTGSIWLGTYDGGLNRLEPKSGAFVHYRSDPRNPKGLDNDRVYSIYEDRAGTLWAGTVRGINRLDRKSGSFSHVWPVPLEVQNGPIYFFLEDRTGRFWHGGGRLFDRDTGISTFVGNAGGLSMHEDRAGDLWFASLGGLEKMDAGGKRHQIDVSSSGSGGPASVQVNLFHEDGAGILWLATETGLVRLDPKTEKYTTYTTHEGLPDNVVQCILSDRAGNLWLSTNNGLSVFNPREISFRNYHESDGLQGEQFNRKACFQNAAGLMYFGGIHGFNAFDPSQVGSGSAVPPPLVLTEFQIHGRTVPVRRGSLLPRPIWEMETLRLSYQENGFTFEFAALSYASPGRTRYRFRLAGLEDEWTSVDSRHRFARYTDLRPADYKFQVQASTDGRTWDQQGTSLGISILPPWWLTPWSRAGAILALAGLIFGAYHWRVRSLREHELQLEALVEQRTAELVEARDQTEAANQAAQVANRAKSTFLSNMSHELRTPLNSILGFSNLLRRGEDISAAQRKDLDTINRSGEHLLGLINDVLDVAKIEAGRVTLESAPCDLRALVRVVVDMMQVRAAAKDLQLIVEESGGFPRFIRVDASKMREILINLIINAIKFTQRGSVVLRLAAAPEDASNRVRLRLEVEDTGIGIAPEDQAGIFEAFSQVGAALRKGTGHGTGLGLTIVKQYVELMGGSIRLQSVLGQGSRFCVELPVALATESEVTPPRDERRVIRIEAGQQEYRILVVEDDMESRQLLQRLLEDAGFAVRVAENGAEGVAVFPSWMPHFIWMDRRMPEMDGLEATGRIRKLEGGQEVVIAVTASVLDSQLNDVLSAGMDDFLRKPYRPAEIFDCMARHLGLRYVYADDAPRPGTQDSLPLRPEALAALSEELRGELANALMSLDADRIARVIRGISEVDPALGAVVAQFADRLAYTPILRALRAGTGKVEFAEGDS